MESRGRDLFVIDNGVKEEIDAVIDRHGGSPRAFAPNTGEHL